MKVTELAINSDGSTAKHRYPCDSFSTLLRGCDFEHAVLRVTAESYHIHSRYSVLLVLHDSRRDQVRHLTVEGADDLQDLLKALRVVARQVHTL